MESMRSPGNTTLEKWFYMMLPALTIFAFLLIWEGAVKVVGVDPTKVAAPTDILKAFVGKLSTKGPDGSLIQTNVLASLRVSVTGLLVAVAVGIPMGLVMGWYKLADRFIRPIFEIVRPIPPVAWIPLTILWIGVGLQAKAMIIFFSAFVPCVINSYTGIRQTSIPLINVSRTFGASDFYTFVHVGIPSAVPLIFAGMRVALANSWGTLVAAEMLSASAGLGYMINMARQFGRIDVIMLGMVCIGILGYLFTWFFDKLERRIVKGRTV